MLREKNYVTSFTFLSFKINVLYSLIVIQINKLITLLAVIGVSAHKNLFGIRQIKHLDWQIKIVTYYIGVTLPTFRLKS